MNAQRNVTAKLAQLVEGGQWDVDLIPNALHVDNDTTGMLLHAPSRERGNHDCLRVASFSGLTRRQLRGCDSRAAESSTTEPVGVKL